MLTRQELMLLQEQLALALAVGEPKNSIRAYFDIDATTLLRDLPIGLRTNDEYAAFVIDYCVRSRWSLNPSLMEKLLSKLIAAGLSAGIAELSGALARVKLQQDPNDDCYTSYWVLNGQPFLNRQTLRPLLKDFIQSNTRSLLQIAGPGAGRTYTREFFDYLASQFGELHLVPIILSKKDGPSYNVEALAEDILNPMGVGVPESSSSSDAASLCRLILRTTKLQPGLWIFVLDGFGQADLQPQVQELVRLLTVKCTSPEYRRKMRLVLVNYTVSLEDVLPAAIVNENIPLPSVSRQDLINCLLQLNEQRRQARAPLLDGLDVIADAMLAAAPQADDPRATEKARLKFLNDRLSAIATGLRGADGS